MTKTISEYIKEREGEFVQVLKQEPTMCGGCNVIGVGKGNHMSYCIRKDRLEHNVAAFHLASLKGLCEVIQAMGEERKEEICNHTPSDSCDSSCEYQEADIGYNCALADLSEEIANQMKLI